MYKTLLQESLVKSDADGNLKKSKKKYPKDPIIETTVKVKEEKVEDSEKDKKKQAEDPIKRFEFEVANEGEKLNFAFLYKELQAAIVRIYNPTQKMRDQKKPEDSIDTLKQVVIAIIKTHWNLLVENQFSHLKHGVMEATQPFIDLIKTLIKDGDDELNEKEFSLIKFAYETIEKARTLKDKYQTRSNTKGGSAITESYRHSSGFRSFDGSFEDDKSLRFLDDDDVTLTETFLLNFLFDCTYSNTTKKTDISGASDIEALKENEAGKHLYELFNNLYAFLNANKSEHEHSLPTLKHRATLRAMGKVLKKAKDYLNQRNLVAIKSAATADALIAWMLQIYFQLAYKMDLISESIYNALISSQSPMVPRRSHFPSSDRLLPVRKEKGQDSGDDGKSGILPSETYCDVFGNHFADFVTFSDGEAEKSTVITESGRVREKLGSVTTSSSPGAVRNGMFASSGVMDRNNYQGHAVTKKEYEEKSASEDEQEEDILNSGSSDAEEHEKDEEEVDFFGQEFIV